MFLGVVKNNVLKKIASVFVTVILCISIALCCITIVKSALGMDKSIFGMRVFYLVSGSMEPTIPTGSAVLVRKCNSYKMDDVITFSSTDSRIYGYANTHRIVGINEENGQREYITKGDANPVADSTTVKENAIYGKVLCHTGRARWLGTLIGMLTTPLGFIAVIVVPVMAIIAVVMRNFTKEYKKAIAEEAKKNAESPAQAENMTNTDPNERE